MKTIRVLPRNRSNGRATDLDNRWTIRIEIEGLPTIVAPISQFRQRRGEYEAIGNIEIPAPMKITVTDGDEAFITETHPDILNLDINVNV